MGIKLNLGCGTDIKDGFINVDFVPNNGIDLVANLNYELPFPSDSVDFIYLSHVLEHLDCPSKFLLEAHRIMKIGATIEIIVPHRDHNNAYSIFHTQYFDENSFDDLSQTSSSLQNKNLFRIEKKIVKRQHIWSDWHIQKYFHVDTQKWPTGIKKEVQIILIKI
jgi:predicted SAM-dependent methyltransferase